MAKERQLLTPKQQKEILSFLRAGAFLHVAVKATGVSWPRFRRRLTRGRKKGSPPSDHLLLTEVEQAQAQARLRAEMEIHEKNPLAWLKHGPGRPQLDQPGWTNPARGDATARSANPTNWLTTSSGQEFVANMLEELEDHPEKRRSIAARIDRKSKV